MKKLGSHLLRSAKSAVAKVNRPFTKGKKTKGMTLIEIIIVVGLLATLMTILISNFASQSDQAKVDQARIAMGNIGQSLMLYRAHNNKYPTTAEGLNALVEAPASGDAGKRWRGPYIEKEKLNDPWGNPFDYKSDGRKFQIISGGINQAVGAGSDIVYPEENNVEQ